MTYAEAITELESLLQQLQEVPADIDRLQERVARAQAIIADCRSRLRSVEAGLDKLDNTVA